MRNTEQRTAAVRARVSELEYDSRWRRNLGISIASVAACLLLILGLSFAMPGLSTQISAVSAADNRNAVNVAAAVFLIAACAYNSVSGSFIKPKKSCAFHA